MQVEAGADFVVTQLFYDVDRYVQYVKDCRCGAGRYRAGRGAGRGAVHGGAVLSQRVLLPIPHY